MFRFFKFIVLFILGYKVLKMLFAENKPQKAATPSPKQNLHNNNTAQNPAVNHTKFNDAEVIDYEEVK